MVMACGNGTRAPHRNGTRASGTLRSDCSDRPNPGITLQLLVVWIHCCVDVGPGIYLHGVNFHTPCQLQGRSQRVTQGKKKKNLFRRPSGPPRAAAPTHGGRQAPWSFSSPPDKAVGDASSPQAPIKSQGSLSCRLQGAGAGCPGQLALPAPFSALGQLQDTALCSVA